MILRFQQGQTHIEMRSPSTAFAKVKYKDSLHKSSTKHKHSTVLFDALSHQFVMRHYWLHVVQ